MTIKMGEIDVNGGKWGNIHKTNGTFSISFDIEQHFSISAFPVGVLSLTFTGFMFIARTFAYGIV